MHEFQASGIELLPFGLDIKHLPNDHAARPRSRCHPPNHRENGFRRDPGSPVGYRLEREGEKSVTGENCDRFAKHLMVRRPAAPKVVVVQRGKIVVDEREGVNELEGAGGWQGGFVSPSHRLTSGQSQHRPDALATVQHAVSHRPVDYLRKAVLRRQVFREGGFDQRALLCQIVPQIHRFATL